MQNAATKQASAFEVALIIAIFAGWFILGSLNAVMTGFPAPILSNGVAAELIAVECVAFAVAAGVLWSRGWRKQDFAFAVSLKLTAMGLLVFAMAFVIDLIAMQIVGPFLSGREFVEEFGRSISLNIPLAILLSVVNGMFEEFFLTRYLLSALQGNGAAFAIGVSALIRVSYHLYQGPTGATSALIFGIVLASFYWRQKTVWPVMVAHIVADLTAVV